MYVGSRRKNVMAKAVKLSEHNEKIDRISKENSDLSCEFVEEILVAKEEARAIQLEPYAFEE